MGQARDATADGIALGNHAEQMFAVRPWAADLSAPLKTSSLAPARCIVSNEARNPLRRSSKQHIGLSADDLHDLKVELRSASNASQSLLLFLEAPVALPRSDQLAAQPQWRPMLLSMATSAPTCQLLPPALYAVAQELSHSRSLTSQSEALLAHHSPLLHDALAAALSTTPPCAQQILTFVDQMLKVSPACSVQASFCQLRLRRDRLRHHRATASL